MGTIMGTLTKRERDRQRHHNPRWVDFDRDEYARTKNPFFVWTAIGLCVAADLPFPPWVLEYLGAVSRNIRSLGEPATVPRKGHVAQAVAKATGFVRGNGASNVFRDAFAPGHEIMIAMGVYHCETDNWSNQRKGLEPTYTWQAICEAGAARHNDRCDCGRRIGWKTAERYFRKHASLILPGDMKRRRALARKGADILR